MSKKNYTIHIISKDACGSILLEWHYLKDVSRGFKSGINYGLFLNDKLVGVCIYTGFPVPELLKGMYDLPRTEQEGFYELSRLCIHPTAQQEEHNLASWFVSRTIRMLRRSTRVRSILSYADDDWHKGTVYRACNFTYYGLTAAKKDFWIKQADGSYIKHSRGKTKGVDGEWRNRSRKHRFVMSLDKSLTMKWRSATEEVI